MNENNPLISICIPCFKREAQVKRTLLSIYETNKEVPLDVYEVVISDNDPDCALSEIAKEFSSKPNFSYHPTKCEGFMNSYHALTYGHGLFLKLHNSQNVFYPGVLARMIALIKENERNKPYMFFSNGWLDWKGERMYNRFEDFMLDLSYWSSSSAGFGIWKEDFDSVGEIELDPLFPHTSLFMTQYGKKSFCIDNAPMFYAQRIPKRGDHNKFKAFTIHYPRILAESCDAGHISSKCRDIIYKAIYTKFLPTLLFNKYVARIETYDSTGFKENCGVYFPPKAYYLAWLNVCLIPYDIIRRRLRQKLYRQ